MKFRALLIVAFLMFSTSSITHAMSVFPAATNDLDLKITSNINFWDGLETAIALNDELQKSNMYTVRKGDNLYRIALNHNVSVQMLMNWNFLTSEKIFPGDELKIIGGAEVAPKKVEENSVALVTTPEPTPIAIPEPEPTSEQAPEPTPTPAVSEPVEQPQEEVQAAPPEEEEAVKEMTVTATAYTAYCTGCSGTTAIGIDLRANPNQRVIAVDPRVIPLGAKVWVEGYGEAIAGDTGGAIKGNKIDVFIPSEENAMEWGVKTVKIKILD